VIALLHDMDSMIVFGMLMTRRGFVSTLDNCCGASQTSHAQPSNFQEIPSGYIFRHTASVNALLK
jgi:hypothetical protein